MMRLSDKNLRALIIVAALVVVALVALLFW